MRLLLAGLLCDGHVLLIGVPGLAKTLLVRTLARSLGWRFNRIQFTPDLMPTDITGMELLDETEGRRQMQFRPGPVFTDLLLADEINRTPPKTQAALLEAMQERQVTSLGVRHRIDDPFMVIATQNPIEQEGTYPLPEAQLDRFLLSHELTYPDREQERDVVRRTTGEHAVDRLDRDHDGSRVDVGSGDDHPPDAEARGVLSREGVRETQRLVRRIPVPEHVVDLALDLVRATRPQFGTATAPAADAGDTSTMFQRLHAARRRASAPADHGTEPTGLAPETQDFVNRNIAFGAGPRASQAIVLVAKALALLDGQPAATRDHALEAARAVLRHRLVPSFQAAGGGLTPDAIVAGVIAGVTREPAPEAAT